MKQRLYISTNLSLDRNWRKIEPLLGILSTNVYKLEFHIIFFILSAYKYVGRAVLCCFVRKCWKYRNLLILLMLCIQFFIKILCYVVRGHSWNINENVWRILINFPKSYKLINRNINFYLLRSSNLVQIFLRKYLIERKICKAKKK